MIPLYALFNGYTTISLRSWKNQMQVQYKNNDSISNLRMLKIKDVSEKCQISRSSIYEKLNIESKRHDPEFPKPCKLGMNSVAWFENEINEWLKTRPKYKAF